MAMHMRMAKMAMRQAMRSHAQSVARGRAAAQGMVRKQQMQNARLQLKAQQAEKLRRSLAEAMSIPLDCSPVRYSTGGCALLIESNWVWTDGISRVVLGCNSELKPSGRPAAAVLLTEDSIDFVDLSARPLTEILRQGQLYVFEATLTLPSGEVYAVLPAGFQLQPNDHPGLWTFPTAGAYRGKPFMIGPGGAGTFADPSLQSVLAVRPSDYDPGSQRWLWAGRSSRRRGDRIQLHVADLLDGEGRRQRIFEMPPLKPGGDYAMVACTNRDDRGDPLGVMDTMGHKGCGILRINGDYYLTGRPNQRDQRGREVLALPGREIDNMWIVSFPYRDGLTETEIQLQTNVTLKDGSKWFVRYPNIKDKKHAIPLVHIHLSAVSTPWVK
jgi:hypothetical protein